LRSSTAVYLKTRMRDHPGFLFYAVFKSCNEALKYPSVGCFYRPMGVPNPSARTYSVQTGDNAKSSVNKLQASRLDG